MYNYPCIIMFLLMLITQMSCAEQNVRDSRGIAHSRQSRAHSCCLHLSTTTTRNTVHCARMCESIARASFYKKFELIINYKYLARSKGFFVSSRRRAQFAFFVYMVSSFSRMCAFASRQHSSVFRLVKYKIVTKQKPLVR